MEQPRLTFPSQQKGQHILVETEPTALKAWLKSLPYGDMGRAVPEVTRAIASLNRSAITLTQRKELVMLFDTTYGQIFDSYRPYAAHITNTAIREKEHGNLHKLTREMAFAHKIITDGELSKKKLFGKNKDLIKAINLSMHYLGLLLMEHYEFYTPIPLYIWRECNELYAYAQDRQFEDFEIFTQHYHHCLPSIERTFARSCLMALADPYHLSTGEHWQVYKYLENWSQQIVFTDDFKDFEQQKCFVITLGGQHKPNYGSQFEDELQSGKHCLMLTRDIVRQLQFQADTLAQTKEVPEGFYSNIRPATALALLEHLAMHWNAKVERKNRRYPVITKLDIVWGLHAIHSLLTKHRKSKESLQWDSATISSFVNEDQHAPINWDATNVSDGGIGITNHQNVGASLRVGELVLIREYIDAKPSQRWRPAICRWLYGDDNQGTNVGLEFINGDLIPCRLNSKSSSSSRNAGQYALLFKDISAKPNEPYSIMATRGTFREGRDFMLRYGNRLEDVKTRKRTMVTPCVELFHYQTYDVIQVEEKTQDESEMIPWTNRPAYDEDDKKNGGDIIDLDSVRLPGDH